jgi:hypothetical protein
VHAGIGEGQLGEVAVTAVKLDTAALLVRGINSAFMLKSRYIVVYLKLKVDTSIVVWPEAKLIIVVRPEVEFLSWVG